MWYLLGRVFDMSFAPLNSSGSRPSSSFSEGERYEVEGLSRFCLACFSLKSTASKYLGQTSMEESNHPLFLFLFLILTLTLMLTQASNSIPVHSGHEKSPNSDRNKEKAMEGSELAKKR